MIKDEILAIKTEVDDFIADFILHQKPKCAILFEAMAYSVDKRGKRLRSFMVCKSCEEYKIPKNVAMVICLCVEMIHAYSLIHDDMPCMDNSNARDGLPTNHIKYGDANALLAGNSLLTLVFEVLSSGLLILDDREKLSILNVLAVAFGYNGVMGGQAIDVMIAKNEIKDLSLEKIFEMQKLKTGEFFAFCSSVGALINGSLNELNNDKNFGYLFGKLYQVVDDIIDEGEDSKNSVLNFVSKHEALNMAKQFALDAKNSTNINSFKNLTDYVIGFLN